MAPSARRSSGSAINFPYEASTRSERIRLLSSFRQGRASFCREYDREFAGKDPKPSDECAIDDDESKQEQGQGQEGEQVGEQVGEREGEQEGGHEEGHGEGQEQEQEQEREYVDEEDGEEDEFSSDEEFSKRRKAPAKRQTVETDINRKLLELIKKRNYKREFPRSAFKQHMASNWKAGPMPALLRESTSSGPDMATGDRIRKADVGRVQRRQVSLTEGASPRDISPTPIRTSFLQNIESELHFTSHGTVSPFGPVEHSPVFVSFNRDSVTIHPSGYSEDTIDVTFQLNDTSEIVTGIDNICEEPILEDIQHIVASNEFDVPHPKSCNAAVTENIIHGVNPSNANCTTSPLEAKCPTGKVTICKLQETLPSDFSYADEYSRLSSWLAIDCDEFMHLQIGKNPTERSLALHMEPHRVCLACLQCSSQAPRNDYDKCTGAYFSDVPSTPSSYSDPFSSSSDSDEELALVSKFLNLPED